MVKKAREYLKKPKLCPNCRAILPAGKNRKRIWNRLLCSDCFEAELLKIENPVERARIRFEMLKKHGHSKIALNFDELMKLCSNDCNAFAQIAESGEVSRERIRQLYQEIFADITPGRPDGRTRFKVCARKRGIQRAADDFKHYSKFTLIIEEATKRGYEIKPVLTKYSRRPNRKYFSKTKLLINSYLVGVVKTTSQCKAGKRTYFVLPVGSAIKVTKFMIGIVGEKSESKIYIIPTEILLELLGDRNKFYIYIPVKKLPPYHNMRPRVDWWQYLDAWHLLINKSNQPT